MFPPARIVAAILLMLPVTVRAQDDGASAGGLKPGQFALESLSRYGK